MTNWKEVKLGEVAPFKYGKSKVARERLAGKYEVYSSAGLCGYSNDILANSGIIIGRKGSIGTVYYSDKPFFAIDTAFYVDEVDKNSDINFMYYYLKTLRLEEYNNDAAVPGLNRNLAHGLWIKIPSLASQEKIANVLSTYDKLIENNSRRIEVLEQTAEEIYKEWFVRMRFPGYENTKFDKDIPEGWEVKKIGDIFNVSSSKRVYRSDYVESGIPFYRSKEVIKISNGEVLSELLYISDNKYEEFKKKFGVPQKNDVLITSVGTIGIPLLITDNNPFYFKDGNLTWIQSSLNPELSYYLYYWLKSDIGYRSIQMYTIGTSQSALTITNLKKLKLLLPNETVLHRFNNIFEDLNMKTNYLNQKNQNLKKQRDLLLPRLMNGTIEVK